jgi:hypothetical protein
MNMAAANYNGVLSAKVIKEYNDTTEIVSCSVRNHFFKTKNVD